MAQPYRGNRDSEHSKPILMYNAATNTALEHLISQYMMLQPSAASRAGDVGVTFLSTVSVAVCQGGWRPTR